MVVEDAVARPWEAARCRGQCGVFGYHGEPADQPRGPSQRAGAYPFSTTCAPAFPARFEIATKDCVRCRRVADRPAQGAIILDHQSRRCGQGPAASACPDRAAMTGEELPDERQRQFFVRSMNGPRPSFPIRGIVGRPGCSPLDGLRSTRHDQRGLRLLARRAGWRFRLRR